MKLTLELPEETGAALLKAAQWAQKEPAFFVADLIIAHAANWKDADIFRGTIEQALYEAMNRTPEQIAKMRARAVALARPTRPLPPWQDPGRRIRWRASG